MEEQNEDKRQNQEDVIPGSQLDKIVNEPEEKTPLTNGTGANHAVPTSGTLIIKEEDEEDEDS